MRIITRKHTNLVQFRANAAVDYFVLVWLTEHSDVILVRKSPYVSARYALRDGFVFYDRRRYVEFKNIFTRLAHRK